MLRRAVVVGGGALAAAPVVFSKVNADTGEVKVSTEQRVKVKACELSAYDEPPAPQLQFVDEEISLFREYVSTARQFTWKTLEPMQATFEKFQQKYEVSKAHTADLVTYIQEDPGALPRAGIIGVAGLGGLITAYRGGIFRKGVYASVAMLAAASVCYPNQTVAVTSSGWTYLSKEAKQLWSNSFSPSKETKENQNESETNKEEVKPADAVPTADRSESKLGSEATEDHGMSKPEDKEMYSTRGS